MNGSGGLGDIGNEDDVLIEVGLVNASRFCIERMKGSVMVRSTAASAYCRACSMDNTRSPSPGLVSSWYRDGIQLMEEEKKKGSMGYLTNHAPSKKERSCTVSALTLFLASGGLGA